MKMTDAVRQAIAHFPELARLHELANTEVWTFVPVVADGEVIEVRGARAWRTGWADAFLVRYVTDAMALRVAPKGGVVWHTDGSLVEVVDSLIDLPLPGTPGAPHLITGHSSLLWTPGHDPKAAVWGA
ncbi:hypothetical protein QRX60_48910 [Amycolatopsis mongoliensis]|uniref:Uncharacterized protein n=1 Tax=Amycolatopsis mongoliensis TaxID=715475 RepID=A0A9Y2NEI7_9PSEU|nr:hypothetical protein [Amycolatopsis sp. 4-36]WIY01847.1 hypothetical protein QRX60_48910 [Amycolatopsis sp. 4-36]